MSNTNKRKHSLQLSTQKKIARFSTLLPLILISTCMVYTGFRIVEEKKEASLMEGIQIEYRSDLRNMFEQSFFANDCIAFTAEYSTPSLSRGEDVQLGYFKNGLSSIGIEEGIVISTGDIKDIEGRNDKQNEGKALDDLSQSCMETADGEVGVYDYAEINIIMTICGDFLTFEYVFGSEEYGDFECNPQHNDFIEFELLPFGFAGGTKCPDPFPDEGGDVVLVANSFCDNPNQVQTVGLTNHKNNSAQFVNNIPPNLQRASNFCGDNVNLTAAASELIELDGFTTVQRAILNTDKYGGEILPCWLYVLNIKIADVGDGLYDSALFLKAKSFSAGSQSTGLITIDETLSNEVAEGCTDVFFNFSRNPGESLNSPKSVSFSTTGTAKAGEDYEAISSPVIIPAGQSSVQVPLKIFTDNIAEGTETISFGYNLQDASTRVDCGCLATLSIIDGTPITSNLSGQTLCASQTINLNAQATGGLGNFNYLWNSGETTASITVSPTTTTTYTVTITDDCGTTIEKSALVEVNAINADAGGNKSLTCGVPSELIGGSSTSTGSNIQYNWTTTNGQILSGGNTANATVGAGTYTLTVRNTTTGCEDAETVTVNNENPPALEAVLADQFACAAQTILLNPQAEGGAGTLSYRWNTNETTATISVSPIIPTTYTVTITDNCGTTIEKSALVQIDELIADAGVPTFIDCNNSPLIIGGNNSSIANDIDYLWTTTDGEIVAGATTANASINKGGTYSLTVTNRTSGCSESKEVLIEDKQDAPAIMNNNEAFINCNSEPINLSASINESTNDFSFNWTTSNGMIVSNENTLTPVISATGTYTLEVINKINGCRSMATTEVIENPALFPMAQANVLELLTCDRKTVALFSEGSSVGSHISYEWTTENGRIIGDNTLASSMVDAVGIYQLSVLDNNSGCSTIATVEVASDAVLPVARAGETAELNCNLTQISLDGSNSSNGADFIQQWATTDGNIISGATTLSPMVNAPGNYTLTITNINTGCQTENSVIITQDIDAPAVSISSNNVLNCNQDNLDLIATVATPVDNFSIEWTTSDGNIISGVTSLSPNVNQPGNYNLIVTDNSNNCITTQSAVVVIDTVLPTINIEPPAQITCFQSTINIDALASSVGNNFSYNWRTTDGSIIGGRTTLSPSVRNGGNYMLTITNNTNGCRSSGETIVMEDLITPIAEAGANEQTLPCTEGTLTLDASTSSVGLEYIYNWSTFNGELLTGINTINPKINKTGNYKLEVTNTRNGCTSSDNVQVVLGDNRPTDATLDIIEISCTDGSDGEFIVTEVSGGTPPFTYSISNQSFVSDNQFTDLVAGSYAIDVKDDNDCIWSDIIAINNPLPIELEMDSLISGYIGEDITLSPQVFNAAGNIDFQWLGEDLNNLDCTDCESVKLTFERDASYTLNISDDNNCTTTANIEIIARQFGESSSVITPGDQNGVNDELTFPIDLNKYPDNEIVIVNRWGDEVFTQKNYDNRWNGIDRNGQLLPQGTYYYVFRLNISDGRIIYGSVLVVR